MTVVVAIVIVLAAVALTYWTLLRPAHPEQNGPLPAAVITDSGRPPT